MSPRNPPASEWMWFSPKSSPKPDRAYLIPPRTAQGSQPVRCLISRKRVLVAASL